MADQWGKGRNSDRLFSWAPKSLQVVTAAMKLKDACSLKEKLWQTSQHIKKWSHHFANKDPYQFSCIVVFNSLQPHEPQHTRLPYLSLTAGVYPNPCPLNRWCHPTISSSVVPLSSCPQSFPASGSFRMSQFFASGSQSIGVSASTSVLPMNTKDWFPLGWTGWISLQSKGLWRVFSNTTVQKHQFFGAQLSL